MPKPKRDIISDNFPFDEVGKHRKRYPQFLHFTWSC
jgi:hypothetical protein